MLLILHFVDVKLRDRALNHLLLFQIKQLVINFNGTPTIFRLTLFDLALSIIPTRMFLECQLMVDEILLAY